VLLMDRSSAGQRDPSEQFNLPGRVRKIFPLQSSNWHLAAVALWGRWFWFVPHRAERFTAREAAPLAPDASAGGRKSFKL